MVRRVTIDHVMIGVIANGSPEPSGLDSLARVILYGHRRVVILDDFGLKIWLIMSVTIGSSKSAATAIQSHIVDRENSTP